MKTLYIIVGVIVVVVVIIVGMFYKVLIYTPTEIVTDQLPYATFINKKLVLDRDVLLLRGIKKGFHKNLSKIVKNEDEIGMLNKETTMVQIIKKGTQLTLTKAILEKRPVSGETYSMIFGIIHTPDLDIKFKHNWGEFIDYLYENNMRTKETDFFMFPKPIWECEFDEDKKYFLPKL